MKLSLPFDTSTSIDGSIDFSRSGCEGWSRSRPDELELNLMVSGHASCIVAEQRIELRPQALVIFPPGHLHLLVDASDDFGMWVAGFAPELVLRACPSYSRQLLDANANEAPSCRMLAQSDARQLVELLSELSHVNSRETFRAGLGYALARACELHRSAGRIPAAAKVHSAVEQAARLLRTSAYRIDRCELAALCGLSESQLSRLFKRQMGVSLAEFRNRHWIERFRDLFGNGNRHTLVEAALEAGFGSYPQFHRVFKRVMGCSPASYARQLQRREPAAPARPEPLGRNRVLLAQVAARRLGARQ